MAKIPAPPAHLSDEGAELWDRVNRQYVLDDAQLLLLRTALEAFDRMSSARCVLAEEGCYTRNEAGTIVRAHPALRVEKDSRTGMLMALRQLGLDLEPPDRIGG